MKKKLYSPLMKTPSTVLLLDDDEHYLQSLLYGLEEHSHYKVFAYPDEALTYCQQQPSIVPAQDWMRSCVQMQIDIDGKTGLTIDFAKLYQGLCEPKRFHDLTVLVVDHSMPGMDGDVFCRTLKDFPAKKIMLTGEGTHALAVELFNEELIHQFILKRGLPNLMDTLNQAISDLQDDYFYNSSKMTFDYLGAQRPLALGDPKLIDLLRATCDQVSAVEYYLLDKSGSYLMLEADGTPHWLLVRTEADIEAYQEIAEDSGVPGTFLQKLRQRTHFPFFLTEADYGVDIDAWSNYLYPATYRLDGMAQYYYHIIHGDPLHYLDSAKIISHQQFLQNAEREVLHA